jgi:putative methylase
MRLRKRRLEMILSQLSPHPSPDPQLEQYQLSPANAARVVTWAWDNGDLEGRRVCDLGCGTGLLTISAALSGATAVLGVDLDPVALQVARENINIAEQALGDRFGRKVVLKKAEVAALDVQSIGWFDTIIQNPPFGVQRRSSDRVFIRKALEIAPTVYSLHKSNPQVEAFLARYVKEHGGEIVDRLGIDVPIRRQFDFHTKPEISVAADLYLVRRKKNDPKEA